jgi:hypothetical protein
MQWPYFHPKKRTRECLFSLADLLVGLISRRLLSLFLSKKRSFFLVDYGIHIGACLWTALRNPEIEVYASNFAKLVLRHLISGHLLRELRVGFPL